MIPIAKPYLGKLEKKFLFKEINDGWISSRGRRIKEFENKLSKFLKIKYAISCSNGSAALILALEALEIKKGDEVIVPDISFAATINSVIKVGATPVISEIDRETWCLDTNKAEKRINKKTKAIIAVHLYSQPCNIEKLLLIKKKYGLFLIEDSAESFGSKINSKFTGTFGDVGCFSFFANKNISTGEGGCCVTKSKALAKKIVLLKNHGMTDKKKYYHYLPGYNFRMTNLQAAIGLSQMKQINKFFKKRTYIEKFYLNSFKNIKYFEKQHSSLRSKKINWIFTSLFKIDNIALLVKFLLKNGIETRRCFYPFHIMSIYKKYIPKNFDKKNSKFIFKYALSLPTFFEIKKKELNKIVSLVNKFLENEK